MKTKFHPILFSTPMVQGIDENRKTQTRRTKGLEEINKNPDEWEFWRFFDGHAKFVEKHNSTNEKFVKCPYEVGDVLWVREGFYAYGIWIKNGKTKTGKQKWKFEDDGLLIPTLYKYQNNPPKEILKNKSSGLGYYKRNSFFMPKKACRFFLKIKSIRAERLLDISEGDAILEGIEVETIDNIKEYKNYMAKSKEFSRYNDYSYPYGAKLSFISLWESINGTESLEKNPFVWVYEFEKIEKPEDFLV